MLTLLAKFFIKDHKNYKNPKVRQAYGMLCAAYFDPTDRTGVVMLTNGCDNRTGDTGVGELGSKVLTAVYECWLNQEHEKVDAFYVE